MNAIKTVGIIPNYSKENITDCIKTIVDKLDGLNISSVLVTEDMVDTNTLYSECDCLIVLGGDGTILRYSHESAHKGVPILGINVGTIGFMCDIDPSQTDMLSKLSSGDYKIDTRYMFDVSVIRNGEVVANYSALNDAVIANDGVPRILELELNRNGKFVYGYRADGLIIATPTGSTAYSLSAGGPIVAPDIELTCVTPVCPHNITAKPMLFDMESLLTVKLISGRDATPALIVDGRDYFHLSLGDEVAVTKSSASLKLIKLKDTEFYDIIHEKLAIKI